MRTRPLAAVLASALPCAAAFAEDAAPLRPSARPAPAPSTPDWADPLKKIPLDDSGATASFGGEVRERYEYWDDFNTARNHDGFLLSRLRLNADLRFSENVRLFAQAKSGFCIDRDPSMPGGAHRPQDVDELDLEQGFVEITGDLGDDASAGAKVGRFSLDFGKRRLVSTPNWLDATRSWDGVDATLKSRGWRADAFFTQFDPIRKYDFNDSDRQTLFYGAYVTGPVHGELLKADFYYFGRDQSDTTNSWNGTTGREERHTVGTRLFGRHEDTGLDYDFECADQFGRVGAGRIDARMAALEIGWNAGDSFKARLYGGVDWTTGDHGKGEDVQTFSTLYRAVHSFNGQADVVGVQNLTDLYLGASFKPLEDVALTAEGHKFRRNETADAVYATTGTPLVAAGSLTQGRDVGSELDFRANWKADRHLTLEAGYSHFFCGEAFAAGKTGGGNDVDFFYSQATFSF